MEGGTCARPIIDAAVQTIPFSAYHLRLDTQYRTCRRFLGLFLDKHEHNLSLGHHQYTTRGRRAPQSTHEKARTIATALSCLSFSTCVTQSVSQSVPYSESRLSSFSAAIFSPVNLPPHPSPPLLSTLGLQILTTHTTQEENDDRSFLCAALRTHISTNRQLANRGPLSSASAPPPFEFTYAGVQKEMCESSSAGGARSTPHISFEHQNTNDLTKTSQLENSTARPRTYL